MAEATFGRLLDRGIVMRGFAHDSVEFSHA